MLELFYFHDPMCSWCWGFRPTAERLFASLPENVVRINVLGGLAPDSDEPMSTVQQQAIKGYWQRIESLLGTEFNYDFWTDCQPRRSTYPACRAVIAAARQGSEDAMILAIQRAYYLQAKNPSDTETHIALAEELGLDIASFRSDLVASETATELQRQINFSRASGVSGFPSLALNRGGDLHHLALDYSDHEATLATITGLADAANSIT